MTERALTTMPPAGLASPLHINPIRVAQLRQALCEVDALSLRQFLIEVFRDEDLRLRILMDGQTRAPLVRMWNAARRANAYGRTHLQEKSALFCAAFVARLAQSVQETAQAIDPTRLSWVDQPGRIHAHLQAVLTKLEFDDPENGWIVRQALGVGTTQATPVAHPPTQPAARLQAMVALAWLRASAADQPSPRKNLWMRGLTAEPFMRV